MSYETSLQGRQRLHGKATNYKGVDETLSKEGYTADAKAVGDALESIKNRVATLETIKNPEQCKVTSDIALHFNVTEKGILQITY